MGGPLLSAREFAARNMIEIIVKLVVTSEWDLETPPCFRPFHFVTFSPKIIEIFKMATRKHGIVNISPLSKIW